MRVVQLDEGVEVLGPCSQLVALLVAKSFQPRGCSLAEWVERLARVLARRGLNDVVHRTASTPCRAQKPRPCNQIAPRAQPAEL
jgi:hypothetical protein